MSTGEDLRDAPLWWPSLTNTVHEPRTKGYAAYMLKIHTIGAIFDELVGRKRKFEMRMEFFTEHRTGSPRPTSKILHKENREISGHSRAWVQFDIRAEPYDYGDD